MIMGSAIIAEPTRKIPYKGEAALREVVRPLYRADRGSERESESAVGG